MKFEQGFEIYGVRVAVGATDRDVFDRLVALIPPGMPRCDPAKAERFGIERVGQDAWRFDQPGRTGGGVFADVALPLGMLDSALREYVVQHATDKVFVHAGAVAHRGRAILIPGNSFSGKTTLVAALVRAGAEYYSDEHAILDESGLVHPYARPLAIRGEDPLAVPKRQSAEVIGVEPVPVGLVAATTYRPEARFVPEPRTAGQGVLALLEHTAHAGSRAEKSLGAVRRAVSGAHVVVGERGDADAAAQVLLQLAEAAATNGSAVDR
jgi:hypothetical protein